MGNRVATPVKNVAKAVPTPKPVKPRTPLPRPPLPDPIPKSSEKTEFADAFEKLAIENQDSIDKYIQRERRTIVADAPPPTKYRSLIDTPLPIVRSGDGSRPEPITEQGRLTTKQLVKLMALSESTPTPTVGELAKKFNVDEKLVYDIVKFTWPIVPTVD